MSIEDIDRLISVIDLQNVFGVEVANDMFVKMSKPLPTTSLPSRSTVYLKGSFTTIQYSRMVHVKLSDVYLLAEDRLNHIDKRINRELWEKILQFAKNDFRETYKTILPPI